MRKFGNIDIIHKKPETGEQTMNDLEKYREQLALCDDKIIDALAERNGIAEKITAYKEEYGMPILQPRQEEKQRRRLEEKLEGSKYKKEILDEVGGDGSDDRQAGADEHPGYLRNLWGRVFPEPGD